MSIQEMFLNCDGKSEKVISVPLVVDEKVGHPQMEIDIMTGAEINLTATLPHLSRIKTTDTIEAMLFVDLFGNEKVILPERNQLVICKAKVYG